MERKTKEKLVAEVAEIGKKLAETGNAARANQLLSVSLMTVVHSTRSLACAASRVHVRRMVPPAAL